MLVQHIYRIKRENHQGNTGPQAGIILKGATVSVNVFGSQTEPTDLTGMVDIAAGETFVLAGAYSFVILPEWVAFIGEADSVELVGYNMVHDYGELLGD